VEYTVKEIAAFYVGDCWSVDSQIPDYGRRKVTRERRKRSGRIKRRR